MRSIGLPVCCSIKSGQYLTGPIDHRHYLVYKMWLVKKNIRTLLLYNLYHRIKKEYIIPVFTNFWPLDLIYFFNIILEFLKMYNSVIA